MSEFTTSKANLNSKTLHSMLRVNQAGEYGAVRIYLGQMAALKKSKDYEEIKHMYEQELNHLKQFNQLIIQHEVRPTFLQPVWHITGYMLGYVSGLLGEKYAHACTIAVEDVIDEHYSSQEELFKGQELSAENFVIKSTIETCHQEELDHKETSKNLGGDQAPELFNTFVKGVCKLAIFLSKRI